MKHAWGREGVLRQWLHGSGIKESVAGQDISVIPYAIDPVLFRPRAKRRQIAYMCRKRIQEAAFICESFCRLFPAHAEVPWVEINDMTEIKTARVLGESAVFLALSRLEGQGLPPLEAMSAGCLVTGFIGNGGLEYAVRKIGCGVMRKIGQGAHSC